MQNKTNGGIKLMRTLARVFFVVFLLSITMSCSAFQITESFEALSDGAFTGNDLVKARGVTVVSTQASDGEKALLMEDVEGKPELIIDFQDVKNQRIVASVDIMPIAPDYLWISLGDGNKMGPYITFNADGRVYAVPGQEGSSEPGKSIPITRYRAGTWYRVTFELDSIASQTYSLSVKPLTGGAEGRVVDIPFRYEALKLNRFKIWHTKDGAGSEFIDNIVIEVIEND